MIGKTQHQRVIEWAVIGRGWKVLYPFVGMVMPFVLDGLVVRLKDLMQRVLCLDGGWYVAMVVDYHSFWGW